MGKGQVLFTHLADIALGMNREATHSCEVLIAFHFVPATVPLLGPETSPRLHVRTKPRVGTATRCFRPTEHPCFTRETFYEFGGFFWFCFVLGRALFEEVRDGGTYWFSVCSLEMKLSSLKFKTSCKSLKFVLLY